MSQKALVPQVPREPGASASVEFMLAEFSLLGELWRHTDARIETAVNLYLTTAAVLGPGTLLVYQASSEVRLFLGASILVSAILIVLGLFISRRVRKSWETKEKYAFGLGLVRRYFLDADPSLSKYVHLPVSGPTPLARDLPVLLTRLVIAVRAINSLAVGWIAGAIIWLIRSDLIEALAGGGAFAVGTFLIALIVSHTMAKRAHNTAAPADRKAPLSGR